MSSIAFPTMLPRATGLGIMGGTTNMTSLDRMTRLAIITRRPILGNC